MKLSKREKQILLLVFKGKTSQEISDKLGTIQKRTVDGRRLLICEKFGVKNSMELLNKLMRKEIIIWDKGFKFNTNN